VLRPEQAKPPAAGIQEREWRTELSSLVTEHVPDAAAYARVTVLVEERSTAVHLSYDRMASCLAEYGDREVLRIAESLDTKIQC
jgi:hypothetical protein